MRMCTRLTGMHEKSPLGLYESDYGIFRGVSKGRERKGLTRRDMGIGWLSGGE